MAKKPITIQAYKQESEQEKPKRRTSRKKKPQAKKPPSEKRIRTKSDFGETERKGIANAAEANGYVDECLEYIKLGYSRQEMLFEMYEKHNLSPAQVDHYCKKARDHLKKFWTRKKYNLAQEIVFKFERIYHEAMKARQFSAAGMALNDIIKLYGLAPSKNLKIDGNIDEDGQIKASIKLEDLDDDKLIQIVQGSAVKQLAPATIDVGEAGEGGAGGEAH